MFATGSQSHPSSLATGYLNNDGQLDIAVAQYGTNDIGLLFGNGTGQFVRQNSISLGSAHPLFLIVYDLNMDNQSDIAVVNYGTNSIGVILSYNSGSFQNPTLYSTGFDSQPNSIAIADLDNDHKLDMIVANFGTDNIGIFYGYGNGSFGSQQIYSLGHGSDPVAIVVADFNKDGRVDLAIANAGRDNLLILLGYGNRTLTSTRSYATGSGSKPRHLAIGDFDKDNNLDIAVVNFGANTLGMFIGNGNGSFASQRTYPTGSNSLPYYIVAGDFNADNQSDIVIINSGVHYLLVLNTFTNKPKANMTAYVAGTYSEFISVAIGDFNNDRVSDIAVAHWTNQKIYVLLGVGDGSFRNAINISAGSDSYLLDISVGDFNEDNRLDMIVASGSNDSLLLFLGNGDGTFQVPQECRTGTTSTISSVAVTDLNGDHHLDVISTDYKVGAINILFGNGYAAFAEPFTLSDATIDPLKVTVGDFNNDNFSDIVVTGFDSKSITIFLNYGNRNFSKSIKYINAVGYRPKHIDVGDFNNDNKMDIAVSYSSENAIGVFLGSGNGSIASESIYFPGAGSNPQRILIRDCNDDRKLDITVVNYATDNVGVFLGYGNGTFANLISFSLDQSSLPNSLAIGDFNKDLRPDIVVTTGNGSKVNILLMSYDANFFFQNIYSTGSATHTYSIIVTDFNNDTLLDIGTVNSVNENIGICMGNGTGEFGKEISYSTGVGSRPRSMSVVDFNNDYILDIGVVDSGLNIVNIMLGSKNGTFATYDKIFTGTLSNPVALVTGNLNNDDWIDIIVANQGIDSIGVYWGYHYATFVREDQYPTCIGTRSQTQSIAVNDFNGDNILDIAVANFLSSNIGIFLGYGNGKFATQLIYTTSAASTPIDLVVGDFNNDSRLDIAAVNNGGDIPIFLNFGNGSFINNYTCSIDPSYTLISIAAEDFNSDRKLDLVVSCSQPNSIFILRGYGNGKFGAPEQYDTIDTGDQLLVNVADFNGDSNLDISVSVGDNIRVFLGYGNGSFSKESIVSTGAFKALQSNTVGDFNNDHILDIVTTNSFNVYLLLGYGNGSFALRATYSITDGGTNTRKAIAGDFNNDQRLDIAIPFSEANTINIYYGNERGTFFDPIDYSIAPKSSPYAVAVGDFNADGLLDFTTANYGGNWITVLVANGTRLFYKGTAYTTGNGSSPCSIAIADFNHENQSDIVVVNNGTSTIGVFLGSSYGNFSSMKIYSTGTDTHPVATAACDFNRDNQADIIVANSNTGTVGVFTGQGNGSFSNIVSYLIDSGSRPSSITCSDFNNDNLLDIAVSDSLGNKVFILSGNTNDTFVKDSTIEFGYKSGPRFVVYGNFNRDEWMDLAVTNYDRGDIGIILKKC